MSDDGGARQAALDATCSFVVQAPAGSGKTTLLTQRLLRLLTTVEHPEQVVAITFTRKAAEEMRARIIAALDLARGAPPADDFRLTTYRLARAVLAHDATRGWQLALQPGRLRIMTIDALSQHLVRQMPITAGLAGPRTIEENAAHLYREAARDAIGALADAGPWRRSILRALGHLDNDWGKLEALLADMLARRDQWLRVLGPGSERAALEASFVITVEAALGAARACFEPATARELVAIADYAGRQLVQADGGEHSLPAGLRELPGATAGDLGAWQAIAGLLLKSDGDYRSRVDKRQGFPPGKGVAAEMKARYSALVETLAADPRARPILQRVRRLPPALYSDGEWEVVLALLELLKAATAHLMVLGERAGRVDFTAFAMAALTALGESEQPTDLALSMDYRLQHLLVDEFQDTSATQFELIRRLTAGWSGGDGRSLFLVGDPMQSIYRFRQADVSLFTGVLADGCLGSVALTPLELVVNFRAQSALVDWINAALPPALAAVEAIDLPFVAQSAVHPACGPACDIHPADVRDSRDEAERVLGIVRGIRSGEPDASIAILVRSRTHLGHMTARLVECGIAVAAREIRPLLELPIAGDLFALTRALLHEADGIAWLAVLRAPWCGLRLGSLSVLAASAGTVLEAMNAASVAGALADDDQARLRRVTSIMNAAVGMRAREPLPVIVERTWILLGGPTEIADAAQAADARAYLALLEDVVREYPLVTAERIGERMAERYSSPPAAAQDAVQVMTMHRAKGLEFDHVIIPGLGRRPQTDAKRLLLWREESARRRHPALLLAPIPVKGASQLYDYLRAEDQRDAAAEAVRLLYVAVTRARRRLHLLGHVRVDAEGAQKAERGSFLALLWPQLAEEFAARLAATAGSPASVPASAAPVSRVLRRRAPDALPQLPPGAGVAETDELPPLVEFEWAGTTAKHVGSVLHRLLQHLQDGTDPTRPLDRAHFARGQLRALGVLPRELDGAVQQVTTALARTIASERGRWLFSGGHRETRAEWRLAHRIDDLSKHVIIDRSFVDAEGRRWIVDFKTGQHSGGGLDAYLDSEVARYRPQLERYAQVVATFDARPIRLALYFPLLDAWREWAYAGD